MDNVINVGLVEDQHLFKEGIKAIISGWSDIKVTFETSEGYTIQEKILNALIIPNVLLVDYSLPSVGNEEYNGMHVTDAIRQNFPDMKILILSMHQDENFIVRLIEHGAHGYLAKDCSPSELHDAIVGVHWKGSYINEQALKAIQNGLAKKQNRNGKNFVKLTRREEEILDLICQQHTAEEIAAKLFLSVKTVNGHRNNLLQKTNSRNTAGLVVYAFKNGLVQPF